MSPKNTHKVNRDAGTGKFVSNLYAKHHPKTTIKQTVKNPTNKKPRSNKK